MAAVPSQSCEWHLVQNVSSKWHSILNDVCSTLALALFFLGSCIFPLTELVHICSTCWTWFFVQQLKNYHNYLEICLTSTVMFIVCTLWLVGTFRPVLLLLFVSCRPQDLDVMLVLLPVFSGLDMWISFISVTTTATCASLPCARVTRFFYVVIC